MKIKEVTRLEGKIIKEKNTRWTKIEALNGEKYCFDRNKLEAYGLSLGEYVTFTPSLPDKKGRIWANNVWSDRLGTFI